MNKEHPFQKILKKGSLVFEKCLRYMKQEKLSIIGRPKEGAKRGGGRGLIANLFTYIETSFQTKLICYTKIEIIIGDQRNTR